MLLRLTLPFVFLQVYPWAKRQRAEILYHGLPLNSIQLTMARQLGIRRPDKIRILYVDEVPFPAGRVISRIAARIHPGKLSPAGMALGYGLFIRKDHAGIPSLVCHELVHTLQYERCGGLAKFLREYLRQCLKYGYAAAPFELEAWGRLKARANVCQIP